MNERFRKYVASRRTVAHEHGLNWGIVVDKRGKVSKDSRWDLVKLSGTTKQRVSALNDLGNDANTLEKLNLRHKQLDLDTIEKTALSHDWQEFLKAVLIDEIIVKRNGPQHAIDQVLRPLRVIATCAPNSTPWNLTFDDIHEAIRVASEVQPSGALKLAVERVTSRIIDRHYLADRSPLLRSNRNRAWERDSGGSASSVRKRLSERRQSSKLPGTAAFWELVRIAFTESPTTFQDTLRFAQAKTLILTGLRIGEVCTIPATWWEHQEYTAANGRPAGDYGGISRSMALRYFSEKQSVADVGGHLLYPQIQHIPSLLEHALTDALLQVELITVPVRRTLAAQISTGRLLPDFTPEQCVRIVDLFPYLSGNPFVYHDPLKGNLEKKYKKNFDVKVLRDIEARQATLEKNGASLRNDVRVYFSRMRRDCEEQLPCRDHNGRVRSRMDYVDGYFQISDVESFISTTMKTKLPDTRVFRASDGSDVPSSALLFVGLGRSLVEERNGGICDVRKYFGVAPIGAAEMMRAVGERSPSTSGKTLFQKYARNEANSALALNTHSLRHLQNTELFRLGIADTIITKRFGRRSIAQSYEYDHRSLAEELDAVQVPDGADDLLPPKAQQVLRMITTGKAKGPIVEEFRRIQERDGDNAAFEFLAVEADGFHATPYGFCINSFTVDPCPKHLECYNGCRHLSTTQLPEHRENLERLKKQFQAARQQILERPGDSIGRDNQLKHAQTRLEGVERILACESDERPFPAGPDLSEPMNHPTSRSVLDE